MMRVLTFALAMAFVLAGASLDTSAQSDAPTIKIGYAISRTGPFAPGAQATQEPSYILWAEQVNAAGGINVKGQKRKVELISYDDRSEVETIVRTFEKLMVTDKVDLILPPWGSTANFAVAPLADKHGYPVLAPTALLAATELGLSVAPTQLVEPVFERHQAPSFIDFRPIFHQ